ncbi:MAG: hypothetical protein Q4F54_00200 [Coriobacteriia bacterium]|nr:hypothetical protein [Coriobacteriia bacterium]
MANEDVLHFCSFRASIVVAKFYSIVLLSPSGLEANALAKKAKASACE